MNPPPALRARRQHGSRPQPGRLRQCGIDWVVLVCMKMAWKTRSPRCRPMRAAVPALTSSTASTGPSELRLASDCGSVSRRRW